MIGLTSTGMMASGAGGLYPKAECGRFVEIDDLRSNPARITLPTSPQEVPMERISKTAVLSIINHAKPMYRLPIKCPSSKHLGQLSL